MGIFITQNVFKASIFAISRTATTQLPFPNSDGDGTLWDVNIPQSDAFILTQFLIVTLFFCFNTSIWHFSLDYIPQSDNFPLASIPQSDTFPNIITHFCCLNKYLNPTLFIHYNPIPQSVEAFYVVNNDDDNYKGVMTLGRWETARISRATVAGWRSNYRHHWLQDVNLLGAGVNLKVPKSNYRHHCLSDVNLLSVGVNLKVLKY